ncbi:acyl-CoA dehydrogenase C-terminal domain-containing protein [Motiliproteus sp. MSK22-1]|uniref:acyl-CoA dehydrogenase C-terminal domain-containing protein n=1 Tax=Motiliproteus sp. MSK22-1 TaxID=1897630 RepID=UPI000976ADD0|nr:acyl-CoA dehydrogenase C-terminal domain-containing protein [Motiliproteus sp. MSK22-1]OMH25723.1 acyl-CoA dehydrogenase [Motiliproteus sp. MSK22-1]
MPEYNAPLRDIRFALNELLDFENHYASLSGCEEVSPDLVDAILEEGAKFSTQVLSPLNQSGDLQGCQLSNGSVITPDGFKEAYQQYREGGWPSLAQTPEFGGQGLPESLGAVISELNGSANWSWTMYPGLSHGAMATLEAHGTAEQQAMFLPKLIEGAWTGTMCLTEPHCGSDLSLLRTKAEPNEDGSYSISGTKIFISAGDQDLSENIVHIVLARLPDAPAGNKGISLFLVPKFNIDTEGNLLERNSVECGSLEHKMGIHGNVTCVMNFDSAKGYLIGPANKGLRCMFTFMNNARLFIAQQGVCHAELSYQGALNYARERLQMRSLSGPKMPEKKADPIIVHPDVRRMLLTQKAFAEGGRALTYFCAKQVDRSHKAADLADRQDAEQLLALLIPIAKGFLTEVGVEASSLGIQVYGGHGFIREWGMEQIMRDARIAPIYEGTNGIQALDLLGRKVLVSKGALLERFSSQIHDYIAVQRDKGSQHQQAMEEFLEPLSANVTRWQSLSRDIAGRTERNADEMGAACFDYLMYSGYTVLAYFWAQAATVAHTALAAGSDDRDFYQAKLNTARFYFRRILPRNESLARTLEDSSESLMAMDEAQF